MIIIHNHGGFYCDKNHTVLAFVLALPWLNVLKTRPCFSVKWSISLFGINFLAVHFRLGFSSRTVEFRNDEYICVGCLLSVRGIVGKQNAVFPLYTCVCFPSVSLWLWGFECSQRHAQQVFPWPSYISLPPSLILPKTPCWHALIHSIFCFASLLAARIHGYIICILEIIVIKHVPDRRWIKSR